MTAVAELLQSVKLKDLWN